MRSAESSRHPPTLPPSGPPTLPPLSPKEPPHMPRTSHSRFLQLHRRRQVAKLTLQGWTQVEIARQLNAAQSTISRDLEAVWKEWSRTARRTMRKLLDADLARIDL